MIGGYLSYFCHLYFCVCTHGECLVTLLAFCTHKIDRYPRHLSCSLFSNSIALTLANFHVLVGQITFADKCDITSHIVLHKTILRVVQFVSTWVSSTRKGHRGLRPSMPVEAAQAMAS
jgi:hypothetical protein